MCMSPALKHKAFWSLYNCIWYYVQYCNFSSTVERELDMDEKPLQIALDCSTKGLASPKFFLKTSITKQKGGRKMPHRTNKFTSYVGSLLSKSYGSLPDAGSLEVLTVAASRPSTREKRSSKVLEGDQASVDSFSSGKSSSSGKSGKTVLKSSTTPSSKPKKSLSHTLSNQETSSLSSSSTYQLSPGASPLGSPRKVSRPKSVMSKFITRSLRIGKRPKDSQAPSEDIFPQEEDQHVTTVVSTLVSPLPVERRFTMSVVIQIYFTDARKAQLYKSVLVSEKSTTREVIMQALERYNMKLRDPKDFGLFEIIGKWQDVTQTLQGYKLSQPDGRVASGSATAPPGACSPLSSRQRVTAVEEFIVCYARELTPRESPYSAQFYLTTQEGYTRRFELRPKLKSKPLPIPAHVSNSSSYERHRTTSLPDSIPVMQLPDSPLGIFGDTAHRRRKSRRRNQMFEQQNQPEETPETPTIVQPSAVAPIPDHESSKTNGEEIMEGSIVQGDVGPQEIPISLHPVHPVDFSALRCGSPDSGVIFSKEQANSTKSSISSEQENITTPLSCSLYPASSIGGAFLLSLKLCCPEKEFLIHKLQSSATTMTSPTAAAAQNTSETTGEMLDAERILLHSPEYADHSQPFFRIQRYPENEPTTSDAQSPTCPQPCFKYDIQVANETVPVTVNGVSVQQSSVLCHGDLLAVDRNYLFLFQDYSSVSGDGLHSYHWVPHPLADMGRDQCTPSLTTEMTSTISKGEEERSSGLVQPEYENVEGRKDAVSKTVSAPVSRESSNQSPTTDLSEVRQAHEGDEAASKILPVIALNGTQMSSPELTHTRNFSMDSNFEVADVFEPEKFETSTPHKPTTSSPHGVQQTGRTRSLSSPPSSTLPRDRKLMFSFSVSEEDTLLSQLLSKQDFVTASSPFSCKLAPAYILAMCVEYSLRCNGPVAAGRFVRKASERIQEIIWVSAALVYLIVYIYCERDILYAL